jgi:integrase
VAYLQGLPNGRGGTLSGGSIRKHFNALSNTFRRAQSEEYVHPGHNPVASLLDRPSGGHREAERLEVHETALFLEAASQYQPRAGTRAQREVLPIVATFLLTGGQKAEVLGMKAEDVSFDRRIITFRPDRHRRLKSRNSYRTVPLWAQLEEILRPFVFSSDSPRGRGLLFHSDRTGRMIHDLPKVLDQIGVMAGWKPREIRTKIFRHTYCAARVQIVDQGASVSPWLVAMELGHG